MPSFILRNKDIDPSLWERFRARVIAEGRSQKWVVLELIRRYVEKGLDNG